MEIKENQALTPEKKQFLIQQIQTELALLNDALKQRKYGDAAFLVLQNAQDSLQNAFNKLLDTKGIITPSETTKALDKINQSKRARLEGDFIMGLRKSTFYLLSLGVVAVAAFIIIKNSRK